MAKIGKQYGRAIVQPATLDAAKREVDVVFATETPVMRFGWDETFDEVLSCEENAMRMERVNAGLPVLDTHNTWNLNSQLGRATKVWINDRREVCARLKFSQRLEAEKVFQDISDGIITGISVGYRVFKYQREPQGEGKNVIYRAVDWMPTEISLVPVPSDVNSGVRSAEASADNEVEILNQTTNRKMENNVQTTAAASAVAPAAAAEPAAVGARADAAPAVAPASAAAPAAPAAGTRADAGTSAATPVVVNVEAIRAQSTQEVRTRLEAILTSTRAARLPDAVGVELFQSGRPVEECRQSVIERIIAAQQQPISGVHSVSVGVEGIEKKRAAMQEAILHRAYPAKFELKDGTNEYRGMTLVEMGRELLTERGVSTRGLGKTAVAERIFSRSLSSSDFPILFEGAIDKMLRADYVFAEEFWSKIARRTNVNDFRAKNLYQVESLNGMQETPEGSEIKYTSLVEGKQFIKVRSYSEGIKFTRQAFVNDDLDALSLIPSRFVRDWDELRGNMVWALITGNVEMSDGKAIFHADHKNLLTGATGALSHDSLAAAQLLFRKQTGLDGKRRIRVVPRLLVVPPELEITAKKLLTAITPSSTNEVNVFANAFDVIVEPRLTDATAWYLSADPNSVDGLYYAYLEGNENLRVNNEDDFNTDSMKYGVRGDFGAAVVDYRGLVKSNGKA
jgi:phage head maturation protease